jgi:hypothetical protein
VNRLNTGQFSSIGACANGLPQRRTSRFRGIFPESDSDASTRLLRDAN